MTLINRVSRLFRADLHAVLDRVEEPDLLLREAVREMEEELARERRRLDLLVEEQRGLGVRRGELEAALARIGNELDVCFEAGRADLARTLVRRRLEAEGARDRLQRRGDELEQRLARLRARVDEDATRLEAMHQKVELVAGENPAGRPETRSDPSSHGISDEQVEVAFLREQQGRSQS